jgi:hypothetical protein
MENMTLLPISINLCFQKQLKDWAGAIRKEKEDIEKQLEESRVKEMHIKSMNKVSASFASVATWIRTKCYLPSYSQDPERRDQEGHTIYTSLAIGFFANVVSLLISNHQTFFPDPTA